MSNELVEAIKLAMPPDAELRVVNRLPGFDVDVSWKLDDDPERPNKPSKTIAISVTDEAAEDFANASGPMKHDALARLQKFLTENLRRFDPAHNTPKYEPPPVERWRLTNSVLFG
ncbi:hypothetical protein [Marinobacter piscensis]|uniref:hypothetical protein n=1 Tax=Marinobacter piscensis TaxID=1562308 RepID=UPI0011A3B03A|nr:hypothetical protein [Marinobacter piscensis]